MYSIKTSQVLNTLKLLELEYERNLLADLIENNHSNLKKWKTRKDELEKAILLLK